MNINSRESKVIVLVAVFVVVAHSMSASLREAVTHAFMNIESNLMPIHYKLVFALFFVHIWVFSHVLI